MKKLLLFSVALSAVVLSGCKGEDAVAKCIQANINSDIDSGKIQKDRFCGNKTIGVNVQGQLYRKYDA